MISTEDVQFCHNKLLFIQNLNQFNNKNNTQEIKENFFTTNSKQRPLSENFTSVQSLKQFWNNRIISTDSSHNGGKSATLQSRFNRNTFYDFDPKAKSATLEKLSTCKWDFDKLSSANLHINNNNKSTSLTSSTTSHSSASSTSSRTSFDDLNHNKNNNFPLNRQKQQQQRESSEDEEIIVDDDEILEPEDQYKFTKRKRNLLETIKITENFDKFKTADKVKKKKNQIELNPNYQNVYKTPTIFFNDRSTLPTISTTTTALHFPLVSTAPTGDKIHWAKRDELFNNLNSNKNLLPKDNNFNDSEMKIETDKIKQTMEEGNRNNIINNSLTNEQLTSSVSKKTGRKLSFKTHPTQPRKMIIGQNNANSGSKVAALTHRFNQLINQDSKILDGVKRNGAILYKTQNHVYKIVENETCTRKNSLNTRKSSVKRKDSTSSRKTTTAISENGNSNSNNNKNNVKAAIEIFETKDNTKIPKPKVPDKSERVLMRTKEITLKNNRKKLISENIINVPKNENINLIHSSNIEINLVNTNSKIIDDNDCVFNDNLNKCVNIDNDSVSSISDNSKFNHNNVSIVQILPSEVSYVIQNETPIEPEYTPIMVETKSIIETKINKIEIDRKDNEIFINNETNEVTLKIIDDNKILNKSAPSVLLQSTAIESTPSTSSTTIEVNPSSSKKSASSSKKSYGSRIYEKIRLKLTKKTSSNEELPTKSVQTSASSFFLANPVSSNPDQKIVEALCSVNQKIEHLSRSFNDLSSSCPDADDILPNESFLFRSASKNSFGSSNYINFQKENICEAVNTCLISKTQSMDETRFPSVNFMRQMLHDESSPHIIEISKQTDELISKILIDYDNSAAKNDDAKKEDDYEIISKPKDDEEMSSEAPIVIENIYETPKKKLDNLNSKNIYQSIAEIKYSTPIPKLKRNSSNSDNISEESFDAYDNNYEKVIDNKEKLNCKKIENEKIENGYEICDPPEPPPPRKCDSTVKRNSIQKIEIINHRNDDDDENKRDTESPNYEKIQYDSSNLVNKRTPPLPKSAPPKLLNGIMMIDEDNDEDKNEPKIISKQSTITEIIATTTITSTNSTNNNNNNNYNDDENIYDTIRQIETRSLISNCYESIGSASRQDFIRVNMLSKQHSDSMSTLSSEHKTNSLYGTTIGLSVTPPSEGSSENSDEWIDISDGEEKEKNRFIVTRQRMKMHRSPEWSRKICDQKKHEFNDDMYDGLKSRI